MEVMVVLGLPPSELMQFMRLPSDMEHFWVQELVILGLIPMAMYADGQ